jgi:hypothetical protein
VSEVPWQSGKTLKPGEGDASPEEKLKSSGISHETHCHFAELSSLVRFQGPEVFRCQVRRWFRNPNEFR